jgi:hypothetical protein
VIPSFNGRRTLRCSLLDAQADHVGFNGNGYRKGLGYRLTTPGGWLAKAGYPLTDAQAFLQDLASLADRLGLIVVGLQSSTGTCFALDQVQDLALTTVGRRTLDKMNVRIYTAADYINRWNTVFGWQGPSGAASPPVPDPVQALLPQMRRRNISYRALATAIGFDSSFLYKVLNGKKGAAERHDQSRTGLAPQSNSGRKASLVIDSPSCW